MESVKANMMIYKATIRLPIMEDPYGVFENNKERVMFLIPKFYKKKSPSG